MGGMQHVYTLPYPNRDGSDGCSTNRGSTVADVQAPHSRGYRTAVQGILLMLKTLEHGLSGDPQRQVREGHQRTGGLPVRAIPTVVTIPASYHSDSESSCSESLAVKR